MYLLTQYPGSLLRSMAGAATDCLPVDSCKCDGGGIDPSGASTRGAVNTLVNPGVGMKTAAGGTCGSGGGGIVPSPVTWLLDGAANSFVRRNATSASATTGPGPGGLATSNPGWGGCGNGYAAYYGPSISGNIPSHPVYQAAVSGTTYDPLSTMLAGADRAPAPPSLGFAAPGGCSAGGGFTVDPSSGQIALSVAPPPVGGVAAGPVFTYTGGVNGVNEYGAWAGTYKRVFAG